MPKLDRFLRWTGEIAASRATTHRPLTGGQAFTNSRFPAAYDHNFVTFHTAVALEEAEAFFVAEGMAHRRVAAHEDLVPAIAQELTGYARSTEVFMAWPGGEVPVPTHRVVELELSERVAVAERDWHGQVPPDVARQLGARAETLAGACEPTFLAVRADDGRVLSHLDLFVRDGVAQLEELMTEEASRRRGLATSLIHEGLRRAAGHETFLIADHGGRPAEMYRRLGFRAVGTQGTFSRTP